VSAADVIFAFPVTLISAAPITVILAFFSTIVSILSLVLIFIPVSSTTPVVRPPLKLK